MRDRAGTPASAASGRSLVLASASPRRRWLLEEAGVSFSVQPAAIDETPRPGEAPEAFVERLALEKARAVAEARAHPGDHPGDHWGDRLGEVVLGSDTAVVLEGALLGKPRDAEHALAMLRRLAGRTHRVLSGVAAVAPEARRSLVVESRVTLRRADEATLRRYVAGGEPMDKAGGYALQGEGRRLVAAVEGSETNVIGLPVEETLALLAELGVPAGRSR